MKKISSILLFCLLTSVAYANNWLDRFNTKPQIKSQSYSPTTPNFESYHFEKASVENYNTAVDCNNRAIDAMNNGNYEDAVNILKEAVSLSPDTKGFRQNYLIALNNSGNHPETLIEEAKILLGMDSDNPQAAYMIGIAYLNNLKDYEKAADYFSFALTLEPQNASYAAALITALENSSKYKNYTFDLLKKYAKQINESYPYYLLGLKYLDRASYSKATEVLSLAKNLDQKGYAHHAFVRAAFYAGYMHNLKKSAQEAIHKFANDQNISSTKRIYNAISDKDYCFTETVTLDIGKASAMKDLSFNVRPIKSFYDHQNTKIISVKLISRNSTHSVEPKYANDGSLNIEVPKTLLSPQIKLEIKYQIILKALYGTFFDTNPKPNIKDYIDDSLLSLNDSRLDQLTDYIDSLELPDNASNRTAEEIFVRKAAIAVSKGLSYQENGIDQSVEWALSNPDFCDCTEYSRLLTALCLKKNIPARLSTGFLVKAENFNKETQIGHQWCEVYINGKGWMPVDPTLQSTMHFAYFGNLLNDQIFFEHQNSQKNTRIGVNYTSSSSDVTVTLNNTYKISDWNNKQGD